MSSTKTAVRFHSPTIVRLSKLREQHRELLEAESKTAFLHFVQHVASHYVPMRTVVTAIARLDALTSLAALASHPGYVMPHIQSADVTDEISLRGFRHPMTEALMTTGSYMPNDIELSTNATRAVLLTGSNMGGKSSAVRAIALIVVLAQIGSFVPCEEARIACHDGVATRMGAADNLLKGKSTFMVEAEETAQILRTSTPRTLVILDEFGRGTSTFDGSALAYAVLRYILEHGPKGPKLMFITHYALLGSLASRFPDKLRNMHMAMKETKSADSSSPKIVFLHTLQAGLASQAFGIHVADLAGLPDEVVQSAFKLSKALQQQHEARRNKRLLANTTQALRRLSHDRGTLEDLDVLWDSM